MTIDTRLLKEAYENLVLKKTLQKEDGSFPSILQSAEDERRVGLNTNSEDTILDQLEKDVRRAIDLLKQHGGDQINAEEIVWERLQQMDFGRPMGQ